MAIPLALLAEHEVTVYFWIKGLIVKQYVVWLLSSRMNLYTWEKNKIIFWLSVPA